MMASGNKNSIPKLNQLMSEWPNGTIRTMAQLRNMGYSRQLIDKYKSSRWIQSIGNGAYFKYHDRIDWIGGVHGLQSSGKPVCIGSKTALELQGFAHYLGPKMNRCFLFGETGLRLPRWFTGYPWQIDILYKSTNLFMHPAQPGLTTYTHKEFTVQISTPERASIEMMYHVPGKQGFDEALHIMENLATLRPDLVQQLLLACNSIKVKRLFMYMAQKIHHEWFDHLIPSQIDFGKGKRVIMKNGILDKQYEITIERENAI